MGDRHQRLLWIFVYLFVFSRLLVREVGHVRWYPYIVYGNLTQRVYLKKRKQSVELPPPPPALITTLLYIDLV